MDNGRFDPDKRVLRGGKLSAKLLAQLEAKSEKARLAIPMLRPTALRSIRGARVGVGGWVGSGVRCGGWKHRLHDLGLRGLVPRVCRVRRRRGRCRVRCCCRRSYVRRSYIRLNCGRLSGWRCGGEGIAASAARRRRCHCGRRRRHGRLRCIRRRVVDAPQTARIDIGPCLVLAEFRRNDRHRRYAGILCRRGNAHWRLRREQMSLRHECA